MSTFRKITGMAVLAAAGATLGALAGERLFAAPQPLPLPRNLCLVFDTSGSMDRAIDPTGARPKRTQLEALQEAAAGFVARQDLTTDAIGLVSFATESHTLAQLSRDPTELTHQLRHLKARGSTNLASGIEAARDVLRGAGGERWILLFSDGRPEGRRLFDPEQEALDAAAAARQAGIRIVAIGTGLADETLLTLVTGNPENVFLSDPDRLNEAFARSEEFIESRQMLSTGPDTGGFEDNVVRAGIWASLIATCAGLLMVLGQNRHLRRRLLSAREVLLLVFGGVLTGSLSGAAGQSLYYALSGYELLVQAGRMAAWIVLGLGIALGTTLFVPNLNRRRAAVGGLAGGVVAALLFLWIVPQHGDTTGRLAAAAVLGAFTAVALVLLEAVDRRAWLVVHWSPRERSTLVLGDTPILLGRGRHVHVRLPMDQDAPAVAAQFRLVDHKVVCQDAHTDRSEVKADGDVLEFGKVKVQVRIADTPAARIASELARAETEPREPAAAADGTAGAGRRTGKAAKPAGRQAGKAAGKAAGRTGKGAGKSAAKAPGGSAGGNTWYQG